MIFPRAHARCGALVARAPCAHHGQRRGPRAPAPPREGRGAAAGDAARGERGRGGRLGAPRGHPRGSFRVSQRPGPRARGAKRPPSPGGQRQRLYSREAEGPGAPPGDRGTAGAVHRAGGGPWGDTRLGGVARPRREDRPSWWRSEVTSQSRRSRAVSWLRSPGRPQSEVPRSPGPGAAGSPLRPRDLPAFLVGDVKCWPGGRSGHGGAGDKQSHRMPSTLDCHKPLQEKINHNKRGAGRQLPRRKK